MGPRGRRAVAAIATQTTAIVLTLLPGGGADAVPVRDRAPTGEVRDTVVYTVESRHGQQVVTAHELADPAGADRLRDRLRARGTKVLDPASALSTLDGVGIRPLPTECRRYGSATSWCGHVWSYQGFGDPHVYVRDRTPSGYPVRAAVRDWNRSGRVDLYYRRYTTRLRAGRHSVVVRTYTPVARNEYGRTRWVTGTQGPVTVSISTRVRGTRQARKTACHEIGHALGLAHNGSTNSCLHAGTWYPGSSYHPSTQDGLVLAMVYPRQGT